MQSIASAFSTAVVPIATLLLGSVVTIGAQAVGPFLQRRTTADEAARLHTQMRRDKAEQLFEEIDRVWTANQAAATQAYALLSEKNVSKTVVSDIGRVRALITLYFPAVLPVLQTYDQRLSEKESALISRFERYEKLPSADEIRGMHFHYALEVSTLLREMLTDLVAKLTGEVAALR